MLRVYNRFDNKYYIKESLKLKKMIQNVDRSEKVFLSVTVLL